MSYILKSPPLFVSSVQQNVETEYEDEGLNVKILLTTLLW